MTTTKNKKPVFSVLIPAYKSEKIIGATIKSILDQTFSDFELIIVDDCSPDKTEEVIKKWQKKDKRIKYFKNEKNLGYSGNLEHCRKLATGTYIYLMGNDDILSRYALELTHNAFKMDKDIGAVTRPFYCFENDEINSAVRIIEPFDEAHNRIISLFDGYKSFSAVFGSVGQLSGLAIRRQWIEVPVHKDIFPAHIYPFLSVFKKHKIVFIKDQILAVRIFSSQTRTLSSIYNPSPTLTWVRMFQRLLPGRKYQKPREWGIDHICHNYTGLIQIKNYGKYSWFLREVWMLIKFRPKNLLSPKFWFFAFGVAVVPRQILIPMVDRYKSKVISKHLKKIKLLNSRPSLTDNDNQLENIEPEKTGFGVNKLFRVLYHSRLLNFFLPTLVYCLNNELQDCDSVLDIGCGPSSPIQYCKNVKNSVGVEIFKEYLEKSKAQKIHNKYIQKDIAKLDFPEKSFDAVILIEVLEHLPESVGRDILKKAQKWAKRKVIVSSPNGFLSQKSLDNNPWQEHLSGWDYNKMKKFGFKSRGLAGLKFLRREVQSNTMGDDVMVSIRFWPRGFWFLFASFSQILTYRLPKLAFELFSVKIIKK